jgi:photosystem II stability/assembly factor-like uncharacterized protein
VGISADGGKSWHLTFIAMPQPATPVTAFFRYGGLLLANSALGRFLTSADDGASWDLLQSDSKAFFTDSAFDPRHGAIVLTGHNGDVLRSTDGGHNWQKVELQLDGRSSYLSSVRFDPPSASLIAVGEGGTIARSVDGGASWSRASADVNGGIHGLLGEATRHRLIVFGAGGLVADSTDSGIHWTAAQVALDMYLREVTRVPRSDILVATSSLGDFIRSTDGGAHWQQQAVDYPDPRTPPDLRVLVASPDGRSLLAAGPPGSILSSNDRGSTWSVQHWTKLEDERAFPWLLEDRRRNLLVAVEARGQMQVSRDGGGAWQASEVPTRGVEWPYWQGAVLERTGVMLVAGKAGVAARSTDGTSWTVIDTGTSKDLFGSFADETSGALYLMGQDGTLLRSTDSALTWRTLESGSRSELRRMLRDPKSRALLCFGGHGAIVRSTDDGISWQAVVSGTDGVLRKGLIEPRTGDLLLAGSQGALLRSGDGGRSWRQVFTHTARHFNSMTVDDNGVIVLVGERIVRLVPH